MTDVIRVLYVDSDPGQLRLFEESLGEEAGCFEVELASSPDEAIFMLKERAFDCVVSKYRLGFMNGISLAGMVRRKMEIPFIIYAARGSEEAAKSFSSEVDTYIPREANEGSVSLLAESVREVVEKRRSEGERAVALEVLKVLSHRSGKREALRQIMGIVMRYTGVEAVGVRLQEGEDYPYYVYDGFPDEHILLENSLCAHDLEGQLMRNEVGNSILECMCGNIIRGRFDPLKPFFTEGGSFWTNSTTELLASTSVKDRLAKTRNTCNGEGYESVALIPIRTRNETLGLLQLNDSSPNRFNLRMICFLEGLAWDIGSVLAGVDQKDKLREAMEQYRTIFESVRDPIFLIDVDDFTILRANGAARRWILQREISPSADTCHSALAARDLPCELYGETCPILKMLEIGEGVSEEYARFDEGGNRLYVEESANPVTDSEGRITKAVLIVRDVTERRLAEDYLVRYR